MKRYIVIFIAMLISSLVTYKLHFKIEKSKKTLLENLNFKQKKTTKVKSSLKENIKINITNDKMEKLQSYVDKAIEQNNIGKKQKKKIPASLEINGHKFKCKLKLKGDNIDHVNSEKWSFRIKYDSISFAIQHPGTRSYLY